MYSIETILKVCIGDNHKNYTLDQCLSEGAFFPGKGFGGRLDLLPNNKNRGS